MSKHIRIRFLVVLPVLALLAFATAVADLGALAQNANSSAPQEEGAQNDNAQNANDNAQNANGNATTGRRRRGRRGRRPVNVDETAAPDASAGNDNTGGGTGEGAGAVDQDADTGASTPGEATDLSGTWTGRVRMAGDHTMDGEGTLTITGNQFTLTSEGMTHTGRVIAITTRGYTGATFWFTDQTDSATSTPLAASARIRRGRNSIAITPVPGARNRLTFNGRAGS